MSKPVLWIVIPCYNEEQVLPITAPMFLQKITSLTEKGMISDKSRVLFVNDGSRDKTWELICSFAKQDAHFIGISQSRNRGHQNAVLAGLMEARANNCDITISIDCDGQDDINAMDEMVQKYLDGAEVVYGVRSRRDTDTFFKRFTAEGFHYTHDVKKYTTRLFLFALISHVPYVLNSMMFVDWKSFIPGYYGSFLNQTSVMWSLAWGLVSSAVLAYVVRIVLRAS